jgi:methylenetetrahydrofolate dehydrogenase (NADP+)/methenyltetrahydrofolate cyclohydrolase
MQLLDGRLVSNQIKDELKLEIANLVSKGRRPPKLVAIIVGENEASKAYVKSKSKNCQLVGIDSEIIELPASISEQDLLSCIHQLNTNDLVDGFIVQLPLPAHLNENAIIASINPNKDIDGFHPLNIGKLILNQDTFIPATPLGIIEILKRYNIETKGRHAVVVGRSNIVGKPISILLSRNANPGNCTVTLCHSNTIDLVSICKQADILIAAIGKKNFITANMVKPNAVIIDVGINRDLIDNKIYGDVDFENVKNICSYITPVPGGIGLMTIVSLMSNTITAYKTKF